MDNIEFPGKKTPISELMEHHDDLATGLRVAARDGIKIGKYADPTEDGRLNLSVEEALEVAREDQGLLFLYT